MCRLNFRFNGIIVCMLQYLTWSKHPIPLRPPHYIIGRVFRISNEKKIEIEMAMRSTKCKTSKISFHTKHGTLAHGSYQYSKSHTMRNMVLCIHCIMPYIVVLWPQHLIGHKIPLLSTSKWKREKKVSSNIFNILCLFYSFIFLSLFALMVLDAFELEPLSNNRRDQSHIFI